MNVSNTCVKRVRALHYASGSVTMTFLRDQVDAVAIDGGFPVGGFRLVVTLAACSVVAPLIYLMRTPTLRTLAQLQ